MGPRLKSRGITRDEMEQATITGLQWGRGSRAAESRPAA